MALYKPTMVFTQLESKSSVKKGLENVEEKLQPKRLTENDRSIQVSAIGEATLEPTKCRLSIIVTAKKEDPQDAKSSVSRRVEYIQQCLSNYGVKESDKFERLIREEKFLVMKCYITAVFNDLTKSQAFANLIIEKLDQNVEVSLPEFIHEDKAIESLRKQASLLAVHNAKVKAQEMAKFVHLEVGRPVNIIEEETTESSLPSDLSDSVHQRKLDATLTVTSKISVQFELKRKNKKK